MSEEKSERDRKIDRILDQIEKFHLEEYFLYVNDRKRVLYTNFLIGLSRGLGWMVAVTFLFALLVIILREIVLMNLPLISDFLADIIRTAGEISGKGV